ncbi:endolytic transglycosylase MltG [Candidatus Nomurabacteria bacterium]|nr:endolytic transglycosylase MltG [Candidatus Nomurabacteria bacterium]
METSREDQAEFGYEENTELVPKYKNLKSFGFALLIIFLFCYYFFISAPSDFKSGTIISIENGSTLRAVSLQLKENNIIRSRISFEAFVILYGGERRIIQTDYLFENKSPVWVVAKRIVKGEHNMAPIKITIPEGFNNEEIAESFGSKLPSFNKDNFILKAKEKEGSLFPDTYFFFNRDNEEVVIKSMSDNFEKKIAPVRPKIVASGKTEKEIIIMASIIEREARGDLDRDFISGILWKRISIGMPLQADAAPVTYQKKGLPDSPIGNPGLEAINSAIYPKKSNYLYYLHDKEGNIHYAENFEQHKQNKFKYLR